MAGLFDDLIPGASTAPVPGVLGGGPGTVPTVPPPPPAPPTPAVLGGTRSVTPAPTPKPPSAAAPGSAQWIADKIAAHDESATEPPSEVLPPPPPGAESSRNWRAAQAYAEEEAIRRYANQPKLLDATIRAIRLQASIEEAKELGENAQTAAAERIDRDNANAATVRWQKTIEDAIPDPNTNWVEMAQRVLTDPAFTKHPEHIDHLKARIEAISGRTQMFGDGPDYNAWNKRATALIGEPGHMNEPDEIFKIPDDRVTPKGKNRLFETWQKSQRDETRDIEEAKRAALEEMELRMVRPESAFTGKDWKGETAFQRVKSAYLQAFQKWRHDNKEASYWEFFQDTKLKDNLIDWAYPKAEKAADDKAAENEEDAAVTAQRGITPAQQPTPVMPAGVNPTQWEELSRAPPVSRRTGKPWTLADWGGVLTRLYQNQNDPTYKEEFNVRYSRDLMLTADQVLDKLKRPRAWYEGLGLGGAGMVTTGQQPGGLVTGGAGPTTFQMGAVPAPAGPAPPTAAEVRQHRREVLAADIEKYHRQAGWEFIPPTYRTAAREHAEQLQAELDKLNEPPK